MFEPDKWLQLGIAGGALFIILAIVVLFIRSIDKITARQDATQKETIVAIDKIASRHDVTQKETNTILRDFATLIKAGQ